MLGGGCYVEKLTRLLRINTSAINRKHHGFLGVSMIPENHTGVLQTFKEYDSKSLKPGLNFYVPLIQKISLVNNDIHQRIILITARLFEGHRCNIDVIYQYQINKGYSIESLRYFVDIEKHMDSLVECELKEEISKYPYISGSICNTLLSHNVKNNLIKNYSSVAIAMNIKNIFLLNITRIDDD